LPEKTEIFHQYDVVKVAALLEAERHIIGTEGVSRQPRIGNIGTILEIPKMPVGMKQVYVVECIDLEGYTIWLADFVGEELEVIWTESSRG
jgi:hypothetical protein